MFRGLSIVAAFAAALFFGRLAHDVSAGGYVGMPLWSNGGLILGAKAGAKLATVLTPSYVAGCQFQDNSGTSFTSFGCALSTPAVQGDSVLIYLTYFGGSTNLVTGLVDDKGDVCAALDFLQNGNGDLVNTYFCPGITAGATTFTVTLSASQQFVVFFADQFRNVSFVDQHSLTASSAAGTDGLTSSSITTANNGEMVWGAVYSGSTVNAGTGFTQRGFISGQGVTETLVQATAGSIRTTFTQPATNNVAVAIAALLPMPGGTSISTTLQSIYPHSTLLVGVTWCFSPFCPVSSAGTNISSVTDTNGNSCSFQGSVVTTTNIPVSVWACPQISTSVSVNDTITATFSGTVYDNTSIFASEWRNAEGIVELVNTANVNSTSLSIPTSGNTSRPREVIYGFARGSAGSTTAGQTAINGSSIEPGVSDQYQIGVIPGAVYTNTWAQGATGAFNGVVLGLY